MENNEIITFILGAIVLLLVFVVVATFSIVYARIRVGKSEREKLEADISHRKDLMKNIVETQESERSEISQKLHDEVGSKLASIKMILQRHKSQIPEDDFQLLNSTVQEVISTSRDISHNLSSFILSNLGLIEAIKEILHIELEKNGFEVTTQFELKEDCISFSNKQQVYRILQELIVNTLRYHVGEKKVFVSLVGIDELGAWKMEYIDIGQGKPLDIQHGFGLNNIKNRIEILSGTHVFGRLKNAAFSLTLEVPYEK